jgi:hypothetical protein
LAVQAQDKLIVNYQVQPVLRRLYWSFGGLAIAADRWFNLVFAVERF